MLVCLLSNLYNNTRRGKGCSTRRPLIFFVSTFASLPALPLILPRFFCKETHNMYTTLLFAALFSLLADRAAYADTSPDFSVQTPVFTQVTYGPMLLDFLIFSLMR